MDDSDSVNAQQLKKGCSLPPTGGMGSCDEPDTGSAAEAIQSFVQQELRSCVLNKKFAEFSLPNGLVISAAAKSEIADRVCTQAETDLPGQDLLGTGAGWTREFHASDGESVLEWRSNREVRASDGVTQSDVIAEQSTKHARIMMPACGRKISMCDLYSPLKNIAEAAIEYADDWPPSKEALASIGSEQATLRGTELGLTLGLLSAEYHKQAGTLRFLDELERRHADPPNAFFTAEQLASITQPCETREDAGWRKLAEKLEKQAAAEDVQRFGIVPDGGKCTDWDTPGNETTSRNREDAMRFQGRLDELEAEELAAAKAAWDAGSTVSNDMKDMAAMLLSPPRRTEQTSVGVTAKTAEELREFGEREPDVKTALQQLSDDVVAELTDAEWSMLMADAADASNFGEKSAMIPANAIRPAGQPLNVQTPQSFRYPAANPPVTQMPQIVSQPGDQPIIQPGQGLVPTGLDAQNNPQNGRAAAMPGTPGNAATNVIDQRGGLDSTGRTVDGNNAAGIPKGFKIGEESVNRNQISDEVLGDLLGRAVDHILKEGE